MDSNKIGREIFDKSFFYVINISNLKERIKCINYELAFFQLGI